MDYIILNNDGSLKESSLKRYIQQGNHGVDKIFIGWSLGLSTDYGQAVFTLANQLTNTVLGEFKANYPYEADDPENPPSDYAGETCNGWVITLTSDQTTYNGGLFVSFRVIRNGIVQVAFPFALMINETGVRPDTDSGVTIAQLDSYLLNIQNLVANNVLMNVDGALSNTSENPVQNKVISAALEAIKRGSYTKVDTTEYPTLQDFLDSEGEEGYLYLYPIDPSNEDEGYYQYIWENDLWIPLGSTKIDIANMMTTDTDQDVSATKTFNNQKDVRFKAVDSGHYFYIRADGNIFHIGAYGVATSLTLDNYLTKFIPASSGQQELGGNDNKWKTLYLSHYVAWGNNVLIGKDSSNRFYVTGSDGNTKIKVGQNETYFANHVEPDADNTYNLGRAGMKWNITYTRYLNDDSVNIAVSDIATKSGMATINGQSITNGGNVQITVSQSGLFKHEVTLSNGTSSYKLMIINNNSSQFSTSTGMAWNGVFNSCLKMLYYDSASANWYLVTHLQYVNSNFSVQFAKESSFDSVSMSTINSINDSVSPY